MKISFYTFLFCTVSLLTSCKDDFKVRVKNEYAQTIDNVIVGPTNYGTVSTGTTSVYKSITEGNHNLSGTTSTGQPLTGSVSISGGGKHSWTLTILSSGTVSIKED